jgi:DNA-binding CsgD family transcriptional regulator
MGRRAFRAPEERAYQIQTLQEAHLEMIRMMVLGYKNKEIAERLNVTPQNVSDVRNSPLAIARIRVLQAVRDHHTVDVSRALRDDAPRSLKVLQEIRDGKLETEAGMQASLALKATVAKNLLEMGGFGKVQQVKGEFTATVGVEMLQRIKDRYSDATTVEVTPVEEAETTNDAEVAEPLEAQDV